jgi:tRNA1(Val) A37 N6-methylase TrmN6
LLSPQLNFNDCLLNLTFSNTDYIIESILLSSSIDFSIDGKALDIGMGFGAVSIFLAKKFKYVNLIGLESSWENIKNINYNIEINQMRNRIQVFQCDLNIPPPRLAAGTFSYVLINAFFLNHIPVEVWVRFVLLMIKPQGVVTFLIPTSLLNQLLFLCFEKIGNIKIFPVWEIAQTDANFLIVQAIKGESKGPLRLLSGLILRNKNNDLSKETEGIIYSGLAINMAA